MGKRDSVHEECVMKTLCSVLVLVCAAFALNADSKDPLPPPARGGPPATRVDMDRNDDGNTDYTIFFDQKGKKEHEEFDFNYDGKMDDYLYYVEGVPDREEIDSNFDGRVDIWVYMVNGIYVKKYERDMNGDGVPDIVKDFSK
jgi:hypothetical protein